MLQSVYSFMLAPHQLTGGFMQLDVVTSPGNFFLFHKVVHGAGARRWVHGAGCTE